MKSFYLGLDLGQASDPTAIGVLHKRYPPRPVNTEPIRGDGRGRVLPPLPPATYECRHLERVKLGTSYPAIVERVRTLMQTPPLRGDVHLVADATGVGRPVVDMLRDAGLEPIPITITGGDRAHLEGGFWRVPKRDLVGVLQVLLQTQRIKFAEGLPEVATLVKELLNFQVKITEHAHDTYGAWREGTHDDLVLAVAVAAWLAERPQPGPRPGTVVYRLSQWRH